MYFIILLILVSLTGPGPSETPEKGGREPARNTTPMFKGVELYSWKDSKSSEWYFSLLPGTNRNKTYKEVTDPLVTIKGADALRKALAMLAQGEQVFWFNTIDRRESAGNTPLSFPPEEIMKELCDYCTPLNVHLNYPTLRSK